MARRKEFTTNRFNIKIVKCCASCIHNRGADSEKARICDAGEGVVSLKSLCGQWDMKPYLDNAGMAGGQVKKKKYLYFLLNYEHSEGVHKSIDDIRAEFAKKNGSIYLND